MLTRYAALPKIAPDVGNLSSKFEPCMVFRFPVNGGHGTDSATRNAAC